MNRRSSHVRAEPHSDARPGPAHQRKDLDMTEIPAPEVRVTSYEVSCLPEDNPRAQRFTITVAYRGHGLWAVTRFGDCLSVDGEWDYEPIPSKRTDEWFTRHYFDLDTALRLAREHAPKLTDWGWTVVDILAGRQTNPVV